MAAPTAMPSNDGVLYREELRAEDVVALAERRARAIVIGQYYSLDHCRLLAEKLLNFDRWTTYAPETGAGGIGTLGDSLFGCIGQELCPTYIETGKVMHATLRNLVHPLAFPADRVLLELDRVWKAGANLLTLPEGKAFFGLVRSFREGGEAQPHTDNA